jgi:hypothetical protein
MTSGEDGMYGNASGPGGGRRDGSLDGVVMGESADSADRPAWN